MHTTPVSVLHDKSKRRRRGTERHTVNRTELLKDMRFYLCLDVNRLRVTWTTGTSPIPCASITEITIDIGLSHLALQTRQIIDTMNSVGHAVHALHHSGWQANNHFVLLAIDGTMAT
ncbi:hypothetical protein OBBRIDRAFT_490884 [Obba rivulosa]|uniref:Uncharacterized protein n=1 Tax=Obba rivulosa TaxID=1052685 RepID=A0A8E2AG75_9APHY|nr:hypothetical protein OBBRIDRAFT_490884 [Obba rivulosa]